LVTQSPRIALFFGFLFLSHLSFAPSFSLNHIHPTKKTPLTAMADQEDLIANFLAVTGATPEQARFYLEANNWDISVKWNEITLQRQRNM